MNHTDPMHLFRESRDMAGKTHGIESKVFQQVTMVCMCLVAVQAGMHVLDQLYRTINRPEKGHGR